MRKVYQNEKSTTGLAVALSFSIAFTAVMFCALPFAHQIANPDRTSELRKIVAEEIAPEQKDETPPPEEEEKPPEALPPPKLQDEAEKLSFNPSLELASGSGASWEGYNDLRDATAVKKDTADAFDISDLEKRPEPVQQVAPNYPDDMRKAKIEGSVTLVFVLNEEGRVEDPRVENSSRPEFEKPALDAIRRWRFRPGMRDGQAVRTYIRIPMKFRVTSG